MNMILYVLIKSMNYSTKVIVMILSFAFVILLAYLTTKFLSKTSLGGINGKNIKIIERINISADKYLMIIELNREFYFISSDKNSTILLDKLEDFVPVVKEVNNISFAETLDRFKKKNKDK